MGLAAGKLRQRITVLEATEGESPTGANADISFVAKSTLWANIEPMSVKDVINAQAAGSQARLRCVLRYREDINSTMQIMHNGKTYKIDGDPLADKYSGREYMTLLLVSI